MITEIIRGRMVDAMKARDREKRDFYAYVLGELEGFRKSKTSAENSNPTITEAEEQQVIVSLANKTKKAITDTKSKIQENGINGSTNFDAFFAEKEAELAIYSEFMPKQMTKDEIMAAINSVASNLQKPYNKGMIMKNLMPMVKGRSDGKLVSQMVEEFLKNNA